MAPSRYDWKIVDWDVKPQHNQPTNQPTFEMYYKSRNVGLKWRQLTCICYVKCKKVTSNYYTRAVAHLSVDGIYLPRSVMLKKSRKMSDI